MTLPVNMENKQPTAAMVNENGRRRFVRGVGMAVPVMLAVRSAQASSSLGYKCLSPSATASIALLHSRPNREQQTCLGRTPGFWYNAECTHLSDWQAAGGEGKKFHSIFSGNEFKDYTLQQVMSLGGGNSYDVNNKTTSSEENSSCKCNLDPKPKYGSDPFQLGAHLSAAWLNLKRGWVSAAVLNEEDLKAMWIGRTSGYSPIGGVTWYAQDIVAYLKTTMQ